MKPVARIVKEQCRHAVAVATIALGLSPAAFAASEDRQAYCGLTDLPGLYCEFNNGFADASSGAPGVLRADALNVFATLKALRAPKTPDFWSDEGARFQPLQSKFMQGPYYDAVWAAQSAAVAGDAKAAAAGLAALDVVMKGVAGSALPQYRATVQRDTTAATRWQTAIALWNLGKTADALRVADEAYGETSVPELKNQLFPGQLGRLEAMLEWTTATKNSRFILRELTTLDEKSQLAQSATTSAAMHLFVWLSLTNADEAARSQLSEWLLARAFTKQSRILYTSVMRFCGSRCEEVSRQTVKISKNGNDFADRSASAAAPSKVVAAATEIMADLHSAWVSHYCGRILPHHAVALSLAWMKARERVRQLPPEVTLKDYNVVSAVVGELITVAADLRNENFLRSALTINMQALRAFSWGFAQPFYIGFMGGAPSLVAFTKSAAVTGGAGESDPANKWKVRMDGLMGAVTGLIDGRDLSPVEVAGRGRQVCLSPVFSSAGLYSEANIQTLTVTPSARCTSLSNDMKSAAEKLDRAFASQRALECDAQAMRYQRDLAGEASTDYAYQALAKFMDIVAPPVEIASNLAFGSESVVSKGLKNIGFSYEDWSFDVQPFPVLDRLELALDMWHAYSARSDWFVSNAEVETQLVKTNQARAQVAQTNRQLGASQAAFLEQCSRP